MKIIITHDYLLISTVVPHYCPGVLSVRLSGGENMELIIFILGSYCFDIMALMTLLKD